MSSGVYVFVGPTLRVDDARAELEAVYLPPVSQGDVYRAVRAGARAIGLIDGYFERVPAVWHKEILFAMAEGVHVFGSSSMGALRAAELAAFGMVGVGEIFDAFANGTLEDDDEVAVAHGPAETGFRAVSDAMVNIRATLAAARGCDIIGEHTAETLERIAKELFYPERSYATLLSLAPSAGLLMYEIERFRSWLATGAVDLKRQDALALLRTMRAHLESNPAPKRVRYTFEHTVWWEQATISAGELHHDDAHSGGEALLLQALIEEAQLEGDSYIAAAEAALLRELAVRYARQASASPTPEFLQAAADRFRRTRGLLRGMDVERWLAENRLTQRAFAELLREQGLLEWTFGDLSADVTRGLPDQLRVNGGYARLLERARHKQRMLAENGYENPSLDEIGLGRSELVSWYFNRLGRPVEPDLADYARRTGFADADALVRALVREFCYLRCVEQEVACATPAAAR